ncbi:MAG: hypothetical protein JXA52_04710 [Planctomycetes bacterium]|nr:hypothetical protein [Planctomycetota bacterium]
MRESLRFPLFLLIFITGSFLCVTCLNADQSLTTESHLKFSSLSVHQLTTSQDKLLSIAFDIASKIPVYPHLKDRSKMQEMVVATCLELAQPKRALSFLEKIENWRKGACYADLALYCAQHGYPDEAKSLLECAEKNYESCEDWPRDRIKIKIAAVQTWLGNSQQAEELSSGVVDSETGKLIGVKAELCEENSFDEQMQAIDCLIASGNFDYLKNTLESSTHLFNRFYNDTERRDLVEEKIKSSWGTIPYFIRIDLLLKMAGFAIDHQDQKKALELVNQAQEIMDSVAWPLRYSIPLNAKLALTRYQAGDAKTAKNSINEALTLFEAEREKIVNIYRAETLTPLAEAYHSMGELDTSLEIYKKAVAESFVNPNSRPRAEDLSAICCSLAKNGVEPDHELWEGIHNSTKELGDPW